MMTPFDYSSIMMYGSQSFSNNSDIPTIMAKSPEIELTEVYDKTSLSKLDVTAINTLYNCTNPVYLSWGFIKQFSDYQTNCKDLLNKNSL